MQIGVLGANHKSCHLAHREHFTKIARQFVEGAKIPCVLLSTCHRTELYFGSENPEKSSKELLSVFKDRVAPIPESFFYTRLDVECFMHLACVVSGIDSVILGETQIQGQVKQAYQLAQEKELSPDLHCAFQKALKIGKDMRSLFHLPRKECSLEGSLWDLVTHFLPEEKPARILLIGYSEINRRILSFFKRKKEISLSLSTGNIELAKEFCDKSGIELVPRTRIDRLAEFDIIIAGSKSNEYLVTLDHFPRAALQTRLIVDLGVPRLVDPMVGKHPSVTLFNIEEISEILEKKRVTSLQEERLMREEIGQRVLRHVELFSQRRAGAMKCASG